MFAKIGLFTIGGGYAMISIISDAVLAEGWLYRGRLSREGLDPFLLSLILNAISYLGGMMI